MSKRQFVNNPAYMGTNTVEAREKKIRTSVVYDKLIHIVKSADEIPLPEGWSKMKTDDGRTYYSCRTTRHTQWLHPSIPVGTIMPNGLPYGWEKGIHPTTGNEYYICHLGHYNTWSPPTPRRKEFYED